MCNCSTKNMNGFLTPTTGFGVQNYYSPYGFGNTGFGVGVGVNHTVNLSPTTLLAIGLITIALINK